MCAQTDILSVLVHAARFLVIIHTIAVTQRTVFFLLLAKNEQKHFFPNSKASIEYPRPRFGDGVHHVVLRHLWPDTSIP